MAIPDDKAATDGSRRRGTPFWARALMVLGWLVVALAIAVFILLVIGTEHRIEQGMPWSMVGTVAMGAGVVIWIAGFGLLLVSVGRSRRPNAGPRRLKLWAKLTLIVGIMFGVGIPVFVSGGVIDALLSTSDAKRAFLADGVIGGFFFLVGLCAIVSAIVWGRRKKAPDVAHVFS